MGKSFVLRELLMHPFNPDAVARKLQPDRERQPKGERRGGTFALRRHKLATLSLSVGLLPLTPHTQGHLYHLASVERRDDPALHSSRSFN